MLDLLLFLIEENLGLTLMAILSGSFALYYWIRPAASNLVDPLSAIQMLNSTQGLYLDVRTKDEYEKGHIVNSRNIPLAELETKIDSLRKYKDKPVIVLCERGQQSNATSKKLKTNDFEKVFILKGGLHAWRAANLPLKR